MPFDPNLQSGQVVSNQELAATFKCGTQGDMRRSLETKTLVLISNHVTSIYDDRWIDGVLHYTGMGMKGDQTLQFMQNKTLAQSATNGVAVFLFEVFREQQYAFVGQVALSAEPYSEQQADEDGKPRLVWIFPLTPISGNSPVVPLESVEAVVEEKQRKARRLSDAELLKRAITAQPKPGRRAVASTQQDRNPWISEYAKRRAKGKCDLCGGDAPFSSTDGRPYLENHHIKWLADDGDDSVENTVALCPNCHRKMHVLNLTSDRMALVALNAKRAIKADE